VDPLVWDSPYWPPSGTTCPFRAYMEIMIFSLIICFQTPPH
jgi:hypothetical protein